jgi:hypothetical protein
MPVPFGVKFVGSASEVIFHIDASAARAGLAVKVHATKPLVIAARPHAYSERIFLAT